MENDFGIKELYSASIKATFNLKVGEKEYEPDETILQFDNLQLAVIQEGKVIKRAVGGYGNNELVFWDNTREVAFGCEKGVISPIGLSILTNSVLIPNETISVPFREEIYPENGIVSLKYLPNGTGFLYNALTGEKIQSNLKEQDYQSTDPVIADYHYNYVNKAMTLELGNHLCNGYLKFEGKMRLKDDTDGHDKTAIITIPKIRIASSLTMRLGQKAGPIVNNFSFVGFPVGQRGSESVLQYTLLNDDIDSDF